VSPAGPGSARTSDPVAMPLLPSLAIAWAAGCAIVPTCGPWMVAPDTAWAATAGGLVAGLAALGLARPWAAKPGSRGAARTAAILALIGVGLLAAGHAIRAAAWAAVPPAVDTLVAEGLVSIPAGDATGVRADLALPRDGMLARVAGRVATSPRPREAGSDRLAAALRREPRSALELSDATVDAADGSVRTVRGRVRVSMAGDPPDLAVGDRIEATGRLFPREPSPNPRPGASGPDGWPSAGREDSTVATLALPASAPCAIVRPAGRSTAGSLAVFRTTLRDRVEAALPDRWGWIVDPDGRRIETTPRARLGLSMLFGRGDRDDPEVREHFARSGLSHLVAISGFNFAVLALGCSIAVRSVGAPWRLAAAATALLAGAYFLAVTPEPSVMRAACVATAGAASELGGRRYRSGSLLALAATVILLADPLAIADPGFQLTFAAVLALRWAGTPLLGRWYGAAPGVPASWPDAIAATVRGLAVSTLAVWIAVTPIVVAHFGQVPWAGLPLSLPAIPVAAFAIGNGLLVALLAAIDPALATPAAYAWMACLEATLAFAELPARWSLPDPTLVPPHWSWAALATLAGVGWCRAIRWPVRRAWAGALALAWTPIAWGIAASGPATDGQVTMLAVGDGSCYLVGSGSRIAVFDAGSLDRDSLGARTVVPALLAAGVRRIEAVVVSHPNLDHFTAVPAILARFPTGRLVVNERFLRIAEEMPDSGPGRLRSIADASGVPIAIAGRGTELELAGARWTWLHPGPHERYRKENDSSFVIRVRFPGAPTPTLLLTGDLEADGVRDLLRHERPDPVDVLELPHHGSWRPEIAALLEIARPRVVLQSTGPERLRRDRWEPYLARTLRRVTCRDHAIRISFGNDGFARVERWCDGRWAASGRVALGPRTSAPRRERPSTRRREIPVSRVTAEAGRRAGSARRRRSARAPPRSTRSEVRPRQDPPRSAPDRTSPDGDRGRNPRATTRDRPTRRSPRSRSTRDRPDRRPLRPRASIAPEGATR